jgi:hypothetical protein
VLFPWLELCKLAPPSAPEPSPTRHSASGMHNAG